MRKFHEKQEKLKAKELAAADSAKKKATVEKEKVVKAVPEYIYQPPQPGQKKGLLCICIQLPQLYLLLLLFCCYLLLLLL